MKEPKSLKYGCLLLGLAVLWSAPVFGQTDPAVPYGGKLSLGARFSEEVQESYADVRWPAWQKPRDVLMLNLRGTFLESIEQEVNAGLVYRHLSSKEGMIFGANVFYDGRWTEQDNYFSQVGVGLECLTRWVDLRANYYLPLDDAMLLDETSGETRTGTTRTTSYYATYEEALDGFDVEVGVWLPWISRAIPTAVYAGYFDFNSDYEEGFRGGKARLESRIHPRLALEAEWFDDSELNDTDYFVGFRVDVPFNFWKMSSWKTSGGDFRNLRNRMTEKVVRDFRIRTIQTGPMLVGQTQTEESGNGGSRSGDSDTPDTPSGPRYDEDGNIIL